MKEADMRRITVNGAATDQLDRLVGFRVPDGDYWYDAKSGAAGAMGGPCEGFLPPGLGFPPMPPGCSGGGTGVFVNGRELHPAEAAALQRLVGFVMPGRYWVDAQGNAGFEGGPALVNLRSASRRAWSHTTDWGAGRAHVASDGQGFVGYVDSEGRSFFSG
jgi:hypothetical protein